MKKRTTAEKPARVRWQPPAPHTVVDVYADEDRRSEIAFEVEQLGAARLDPYRGAARLPKTLYTRAMEGDADAADDLVRITRESVTLLQQLALDRPDLVRPIACKAAIWPVMGSRAPRVWT